jgi:hypothetical protein
MGGPLICSSCDCGNFGPDVVRRQGETIVALRAQLTPPDDARTLPEAEQEIILLAERIGELMAEKETAVKALEHLIDDKDITYSVRVSRARDVLAALKKPTARGETGK